MRGSLIITALGRICFTILTLAAVALAAVLWNSIGWEAGITVAIIGGVFWLARYAAGQEFISGCCDFIFANNELGEVSATYTRSNWPFGWLIGWEIVDVKVLQAGKEVWTLTTSDEYGQTPESKRFPAGIASLPRHAKQELFAVIYEKIKPG
jgi:hypothetical protein